MNVSDHGLSSRSWSFESAKDLQRQRRHSDDLTNGLNCADGRKNRGRQNSFSCGIRLGRKLSNETGLMESDLSMAPTFGPDLRWL